MQYLLFFAGTLLLAFLSRHCLRDIRSHGFYRFLAWECMLVLLLHNAPFWFQHRFAWYQLLSWLLLFLSIPPVVWGFILLKQHGASDALRNDPALLGFEKTAQLVTHGIYRHIRHPLYVSLLLLAWGLYFKQPSWWPGFALACGATATLALTALAEERENRIYFGQAYADYMQRSWRFIPGVF